MIKKAFYFAVLIFQLYSNKAEASHLMGGEIHWKSLGNDTFDISLIYYRRCTDGAFPGNASTLSFASDSCANSYSGAFGTPYFHSVEDITPMCPGTGSPCPISGGNGVSSAAIPVGIEKHIYKWKFYVGGALANCCWYKLTFTQSARNSNITTGFADADFSTTSWLNRCLSSGDESPKFKKKPYIMLIAGKDYKFDYSATDADGDSLSYKMAMPGGGGSYSSGYSFTYPLACLGGNSPNPNVTPPTGFNLDSKTGLMMFRPMSVLITVYKVQITAWRTINGVKKVVGITSRDIEFVVLQSTTNTATPVLNTPYSFETCVNHPICMPISSGVNNSYDTTRLYYYYNTLPGSVFTSTNDSTRLATGTLCWTPDSSFQSATPYSFSIMATASHCAGPLLHDFSIIKTYTITVKPNVLSTMTKKKLNCRDYDFIGTINPGANTNSKSIRWYINNVYVNSATKVYTGDSLRYRFRKYGKYAVRMEMDAGGGCAEYKYDTVQVDTVNFLTMTVSNDTLLCSGDSVTLKVLNISNGTPPFKYKWFINNTLVDTNAVYRVASTVPRWYRCELTTADSCTDFAVDSVALYINPFHIPIADRTLCKYDSIFIQNYDTSTINNYTWSYKGNVISNQKSIYVKDSGSYILKVVSPVCSTNNIIYDTIKINYYPLPLHTFLRDTFVCYPNGTLVLNTSNNIPVNSYTWYQNGNLISTQKNPVITDSGTIIVKIKNEISGCTQFDTVVIGKRPYPLIPSPLTNKFMCANDSVLLTIDDTSTVNTYVWKRNGVNISTQKSIYTKLAGIYSITVTSPGGCSISSVDTVNIGLSSHVKYSNRSICIGDSSLLLNNDSSHFSFTWYYNGNFISNSQSIYAKVSGTYKQKISNPFGCTIWDSLILTVNNYPSHNNIGDVYTCIGDSASIICTDTITYNYSWYKYINDTLWSNIGASKNIKVKDTGLYYVIVSNFGCTSIDTVRVLYNPALIHTKISNQYVCQNDSVLLQNTDTTSTFTYKWYNNNILISTSKNIYAKQAGVYIQKITSIYGCIKYDTVLVIAKKFIYHKPLYDYTICNGDSIHSNNFDTCVYDAVWKLNGNVVSTIKGFYLKLPGTYILYMTNDQGCTISDTQVLTVLTSPTHTPISDETICAGDSVLLLNTDSSQYSFRWYLNNTINPISYSRSIYAKLPGTYYLIVVNSNFCAARDVILVTVNPKPTHTSIADISLCTGDSITTQNADSSHYTFSWYRNGSLISNLQNITIKDSGIYILKIENSYNCILRDTFKVVITNFPYHLSLPDFFFCNGDSAYLNNNYVSTNFYKWYFNGSLISTSKNIYTNIPGQYIVKVESPAGCILFDTLNVYQLSLPTHTKISNKIICPKDSVLLANIDSSNYDIAWFYKGNQISSQKNIYVKDSGTYINRIKNIFGCTVYDTIHVANYTLPFHTPIPDNKLCLNDSALLENKDSSHYQSDWFYNSNLIASQKNIYAKQTGVYLNKVTNGFGCSITDTILVTNFPQPSHTKISNKQFCNGDSVLLQNQDSASYTVSWYNMSGFVSSGKNIYAKDTGTYVNKIINTFGCLAYDTFRLAYFLPPIHTPLSDYKFCPNDSVKVQNLDSSSYALSWFYNGNLISTQKSINIKNIGTYINKITTSNGCSVFDTFVVSYYNIPTHNKISNEVICPYDSVYIQNKDSINYSVAWYFNNILISNQKNIYIAKPGLYINKVTNLSGCSVTDTFSVSISTGVPQHAPIPDNEFCENDSAWLYNIDSATYSYTWYYAGSIISTQRNIYAKAPGEYIVKVGNWGTCVIYDTVYVTQKPKPVFSVSPLNPTIMKGSSIIVKATGINNTYQWRGDSIINLWGDSVNLKPSKNTNYTVIARNSNNCIDSLIFTVTVDATGIFKNKTSYLISLFPNPATDELIVKLNSNGPYTLTVIDKMGRVILIRNCTDSKTAIDISKYPEGIYNLMISNSDFVETLRFIKIEK